MKQMYLYLTGNAMTSGAMIMSGVVMAFLLLTFFVLARSFMCPDFAVARKSTAWYCQQPEEEEGRNNVTP